MDRDSQTRAREVSWCPIEESMLQPEFAAMSLHQEAIRYPFLTSLSFFSTGLIMLPRTDSEP